MMSGFPLVGTTGGDGGRDGSVVLKCRGRWGSLGWGCEGEYGDEGRMRGLWDVVGMAEGIWNGVDGLVGRARGGERVGAG
jgi:hypothetical protein